MMNWVSYLQELEGTCMNNNYYSHSIYCLPSSNTSLSHGDHEGILNAYMMFIIMQIIPLDLQL